MFDFRDVDKADEDQLRVWHTTWAAAVSHRPPELVTSWEVARVGLAREHPDFHVDLFTAYDGDRPVGVGLVNLPLADNDDLAYAEVGTHPDDRRRGVGSAVLTEVERRARLGGRSRVLVEVYVPTGGAVSAGARFAEARGYAVANREEIKALDLTTCGPRFEELAAEVERGVGPYRVIAWRSACPDELVEGFGAGLSRIMSLIPQGELGLDDGEWTVDRVRAHERHQAEVGITPYEAAAVAPDGAVVGLSGLRANDHDPAVAHVGVTMVLPEHRGHRLGLALKLATHRALLEGVPDCRLVETSNADVNTHMNAINEAMGYRIVEQLLEYHRQL